MLISNAFAASAPALAETGTLGGTLIQLALILLIFYFLLIRPQQKRLKAHAAMVAALKAGDRVLTSGGIYGTVVKTAERELTLEIAPSVQIVIDRMSVSGVVTDEKTLPAAKTKSTKVKK